MKRDFDTAMNSTMKGALAVDGVAVPSAVETPTISPGKVLVKAAASAVNRLDTLQRKGAMPPPAGVTPVLGLEVAGEVVEVSDEATSAGWKVGDRVMALVSGGGNAEVVSVDVGALMRCPSTLSMMECACIPETFLTAFQLIFIVGQFAAGMSVLVHAASSGVGLAAVQMLRNNGASQIITTMSSQAKMDMALSMGATHAINRHDNDGRWDQEVARITNGQGVDLILDCIGASYFEQNVESIKMDGAWVLYGTLGGTQPEGPVLRMLMKKRVQLRCTTLRSRPADYKAMLVQRFSEQVLPSFESGAGASECGNGKYKVVVDKVFPLDEIQQAHEYMESNANVGKIGISIAES